MSTKVGMGANKTASKKNNELNKAKAKIAELEKENTELKAKIAELEKPKN